MVCCWLSIPSLYPINRKLIYCVDEHKDLEVTISSWSYRIHQHLCQDAQVLWLHLWNCVFISSKDMNTLDVHFFCSKQSHLLLLINCKGPVLYTRCYWATSKYKEGHTKWLHLQLQSNGWSHFISSNLYWFELQDLFLIKLMPESSIWCINNTPESKLCWFCPYYSLLVEAALEMRFIPEDR